MRSVGVLGSFFCWEYEIANVDISHNDDIFYLWIFFNWWRFDVCSDVRCSACCECVCQCKIDLISLLQQTPSMRNIELILLLLLSSYLQLKRARMRDVFGWMDLFWFREAMNDVQTVIFLCFTAFFCWWAPASVYSFNFGCLVFFLFVWIRMSF